LGGVKVQSPEVEADIGFETLLVPITEGFSDQALDGVVQAFHDRLKTRRHGLEKQAHRSIH
jgi:hypothetical protein